MTKSLIVFLLLSALLTGPGWTGEPIVHLAGDTLTVQAKDTPLRQILQLIAHQGVKIGIDPRINPRVTVDIRKQPLHRTLKKLIRPYSHVLIWESGAQPENGVHRLSEIHIFEPGKSDRIQPLVVSTELVYSIHPVNGARYVSDELLLRISPGKSSANLQRVLKEIGGRVLARHPGTGIYRIRVKKGTDIPGLVDRVKKIYGVVGAEPNWAYRMPAPIRLPLAPANTVGEADPSGPDSGVPVAVLDSGIMPDVGISGMLVASLDVINPGTPISDDMGHGTQMALVASGTVRPMGALGGIFEHSPVVPVKVFDENGTTSTFHIMESIDFAEKAGARVVSLSWGSPIRSESLEKALQAVSAKGLFVVASAGNAPTGEPVYPAAYPSVVGVGALSPDGNRWPQSNYGDFVTVYAPGIARMPVGYQGNPGIYAGTSIASAYTSHLIARHLSDHPDAGLQEIFEALKLK